MSRFQWSFGDNWVDCTEENNQKFAARRKVPSLEPLYLTNSYGELWGSFEKNTMKFRVHGDDEEMTVQIRRGPKPNELPIYAVLMPGNHIRILSYDVCRQLFCNGLPREKETEVVYATEKFKAHDKKLYQWIDGKYEERRYKATDLTLGHFEDITRTRYAWHFKGPMRRERMRTAVQQVCASLSGDEKQFLEMTYNEFQPSEQDTEYGPYQFPDYLASLGRSEMAFKVSEAFSNVPLDEWRPFDSVTNARFEEARRQKRPVTGFVAQDEKYMVVFDGGTGESGTTAVVIRPTRYQKMLESIEEQFHEAAAAEHEEHVSRLFDVLVQNHLSPRIFIVALAANPDRALGLISDEHVRETVSEILTQMHSSRSGNLTTRLQQFMPALLDKFKECEIKMSTEETLQPLPLCSELLSTLKNGLSIPSSQKAHCEDFKSLVHFIQEQQCWKLPRGHNTCDLCAATRQTTLRHCGSTSVCLKCWSDSLVQTNMTCPFCRSTVEQGQLVTTSRAPKTPLKRTRARKRKRKVYYTSQEILQEIHKDEKYVNITTSSKESMRKWFTILLRRKMVGISQMPRNEQGKKEFADAMRAFKLLEENN